MPRGHLVSDDHRRVGGEPSGLRAVSAVRLPRWALSVALFTLACGSPPIVRPSLPSPRITRVTAPSPVLRGTLLRVEGLDLDRVGPIATLVVSVGGVEARLPERADDADDARLFSVTDELVGSLGAGTADVSLVVTGDEGSSEPFDTSFVIATTLALGLDEGLDGVAHFEDVLVVHGEGFTMPGEGDLFAHVTGTFTPDGGSAAAIDVRLETTLADRTARDRGVVVLGTTLGGPRLATGRLVGTVVLESMLASGESRTTPSRAVDLSFAAPDLYAFDPAAASVGRIVAVRGAGFLGRSGTGETTLLRIAASFTPAGGTSAPFAMELVPAWVSGAELSLAIETQVTEGQVIARLFGAQRGVLEGTATPIAIRDHDELAGASVPFRFVLGAPHQVVELRLLPGYYESLARFGLAAAEDEILVRVADRIESIYAGYNVEVRTTVPGDYAVSAFATVEIGGPDPNGSGLFGYDNSAGKDVGNLRLFDHIGGANAEQADGFPGYGGVFVESMLYWSSHPDLPGEHPPSAPSPESLFDEVFDPVRARPATYDEVLGAGDPERLAQIERAIAALSNLIGETTAHELGHSLGLAQPYGAPTAFHNVDDGEGCLMDAGADRPLGERMAAPGYTPTHFCYDEPEYLASILAE
jgi:hypothetical protein